MGNAIYYCYGRIFGIPGMPTLHEQKLACFNFCNRMSFEWGGFHGDDETVRELPFYRRQKGAEYLALKVGGIVIARFDAAFGRSAKEFSTVLSHCAKNKTALFVLDCGEENLAVCQPLLGVVQVMGRKQTPYREMVVASGGDEYRKNPPLGWKMSKRVGKWDLIPDRYVRIVALRAYEFFFQGMGREQVSKELRRGHFKNLRTKDSFSPDWCEDAFRAVVCGFPLDTHKVQEAFAGFSFRAWRERDPEALAILQRCIETFRELRAKLLESSALAQQLRPQLELVASGAEAPAAQV